MLRTLLQSSLSLDAVDQDGNTLLHSLCALGAPVKDLCELLDHAAEDTSALINRRNATGDTPLLSLIRHAQPPSKGALAELLDRGADASLNDASGRTPLQVLQDRGNNDQGLFDLLLNHGCTPLPRNRHVTSPARPSRSSVNPCHSGKNE